MNKEGFDLDIVFVILNYNIIEETIHCIESIKKKIDTGNYIIVVVDNASPLEIVQELEKELQRDKKIVFIKNRENLGFAKGNNVGINEARKFNPKYICCLNNDTLLIQDDFFRILDKSYEETQAALVGPEIILKDGTIFKFKNKLRSLAEYEKQLSCYEKEIAPSWINKFSDILKNNKYIYQMVHAIKVKKQKNNIDYSNIQGNFEEDGMLHGCCLIFTPQFFQYLNGFDDRTFLYREEELLYLAVKKNKLNTFYCPQLKIKHLEDVSTTSVATKRSERNRIYTENQVNSLKILIMELQQFNVEKG